MSYLLGRLGGGSTAGGLIAQYIVLINYLKTHVTFLKTDNYFNFFLKNRTFSTEPSNYSQYVFFL